VATVEECSGGRAFLGLGVGAGLEEVGIATDRPAARMGGALATVRRLLDGESVDVEAAPLRPVGAALRRPPRRRIPLAVGTRSPQVMRVAGELADTVLVGARYMSPDTLALYRRWVEAGARAARRPPGLPEIAPRLTLCVSDEAPAAYATMRRDTAEFLVTLQPDDLAVDPAVMKAIAEALSRSRGWYFDPEAYHPPELDELVDDDLVRRFAVCGCPEECVDQVGRVVELGVTSLSFKLAPVRRPGLSMFEGLRETVMGFGRVADRVRSLG
jgi:5,10-methylenetetrahydromethanopterin reductase